ncbi:hemolysin XhlA family protein [Bacillus sp. NPDC077411]|uniref:hemolysin XhlA family protein n=1 Tax=Bacillus sp. NPDC077411 TaxID=3363947 RepID=UPI0037C97344
MEEINNLKQEIQQIKAEQKDMREDIRHLENRTLGNEKDIININKQLDKISANTTWILRIIIGAIVAGLLGLLMKGGM